jgi:catechol 2,3-dioxygenase-like lactoylglutathione lyase family enzyme
VASTTTSVSKVANVMIPVADADRAIEFYTGKLGLEKRVDAPFGDGERWIEVAPAGAETTIALSPPGPSGDVGNKQTGITLYSDEIDAYHGALKAAGVDVDDEVSRYGGPVPPMFWFRDPEGNVLLVVGAMD